MTHHATAEDLSAYVDGELAARKTDRIEAHLRSCRSCRERLAGLRRVVGKLQRLERHVPPQVLAQEVARRVALEPRHRSPLQRLEKQLERLAPPSHLLVSFALIVALAVIVYLFAHGVERVQRRGTALVIPPPDVAHEEPEALETEAADGLDRLLVISDRIFERRDRTWWQEGLEPETAPRPETADGPLGRRILGRYPELRGVVERGDRVVMVFEGAVVELRRRDRPTNP